MFNNSVRAVKTWAMTFGGPFFMIHLALLSALAGDEPSFC